MESNQSLAELRRFLTQASEQFRHFADAHSENVDACNRLHDLARLVEELNRNLGHGQKGQEDNLELAE